LGEPPQTKQVIVIPEKRITIALLPYFVIALLRGRQRTAMMQRKSLKKIETIFQKSVDWYKAIVVIYL